MEKIYHDTEGKPHMPVSGETLNDSTEEWFDKKIKEFEGDPLFEAEGRILELEEHIAKSAPLQWVFDYDIDSAQKWEREAVKLLKKGVSDDTPRI